MAVKKSTRKKAATPVAPDTSWAAKYRPDKLPDMIMVDTERGMLEDLLERGAQSGGLLITGSSGTGKTTLARIVANVLSKGSPADVIEHNASERRGVDDIRGLIAATRFHPSKKGACRVVIIDEVHALVGSGGNAAQSALLKPLEDNSLPVVWVLVTDQPHLLSPQLLSRVQRIDLFHPLPESLIALLLRILKAEKALAKWPDADKRSIATKVATTFPHNIREAIHRLQTAVGQAGAAKTFKEASKSIMFTEAQRAEVTAGKDLVAALKTDKLLTILPQVASASPVFVVDALIEASTALAANPNEHSDTRHHALHALGHLIAFKDAIYQRAGQTAVEQRARLFVTLARIDAWPGRRKGGA